jgi:hypothetical protein
MTTVRRREHRRWLRVLPGVAFATALQPALAAACPACFSAVNERVLETYYLTAAFMSVLPLVIAAAFALWLRRHR